MFIELIVFIIIFSLLLKVYSHVTQQFSNIYSNFVIFSVFWETINSVKKLSDLIFQIRYDFKFWKKEFSTPQLASYTVDYKPGNIAQSTEV
jgi:hypothetical protein